MSMLSGANLVVFAAGKGSRLNAGIPKFLVEVEGKPLYQRMFDQLNFDDGRVYIVCGFNAPSLCKSVCDYIERRSDGFPPICFLYNELYNQPQFFSIRRALEFVDSTKPTFFIDGDIAFERRILEEMIVGDRTAVLVRQNISSDAVIAEVDGGRLIKFARADKGKLEWANIAKYLPSDLVILKDIANNETHVHHFDVINSLLKRGVSIDIHVGEVAELDEPSDLEFLTKFLSTRLG